MAIGDCLTSALHPFKADLIDQTKAQNEHGQIERTWDYNGATTISVSAEGVTTQSDIAEQWGTNYDPGGMVIIRTETRVHEGQRIRDIRNDDITLWLDTNGDPIEYDIVGVTPISDPVLGASTEYYGLLERVRD